MASQMPFKTLSDGNRIPVLAFGAGTAWFKDDPKSGFDRALVDMTKAAIDQGYRHLDCAEMYNNEEEVGIAIQESGVPREDFFITTKVADGIAHIPKALRQSLNKLQLDYVDLYLIHEPFFAKNDEDFQNAWRSMEECKKHGLARSIGVSNYLRPHLEATLKTAVDPPVVNQLEFHPYLQRAGGYVPWMLQKGIQVEGFKGLTPIARVPDGPLVPVIDRIAKKHKTTEACVMLSWIWSNDVISITTTRKIERLQEYQDALKVKLDEDEIKEITEVGKQHHVRFYFPERYAPDDLS